MKTPEERKMEKLLNLLEVADKDYVTSEELAEYMDILMNVIKNMRPTYDAERDAFMQQCSEKVKQLQESSQAVWADVQKRVSLLKNGEDGEDGKDGNDGYTPQAGVDYPTREQFVEIIKGIIESLEEPEDEKEEVDLSAFETKLADLERMIVASANALPITTMFVNGRRAKNLSFSGATVSYQDDTATVTITGGSGAVDSVNGQTGVVVLDADDIDDTSTTNKFVTAADLTNLSNLSGTNTGDVTVSDSAEIDFTLTGQQITASIVAGSIDESKLDTSVNASLDLADTSLQPNDSITELNGTAWRVFYSDGSGNVTELALGADGTFLKSNGATVAPSFATPAGSGDVSKVGTPANNQMAVWTGDGTLEGTSDFTYDGTNLNLITGKNFQIAGTTILADSAGTTTLSGIDALDATTEATIEAAIDTLGNLTSIQGRTVTLADAGADAIFGWDDSASAYQNLSAADVRTALGLVIGTNVQAWDAQLDTWATVTPSANGQSLVSAADYAAMRALLDLEAGTDFLSPAAIAAAYQPLDSDLTTIAGLTATTDNFIVSVASAWASRTPAQVRTTLGIGSAGLVATDLADLNEATIEAAIDTLANLTSVQGRTITLADAGADAIFGWDDSASAYQNLSAADAIIALGITATATELNYVDGVTSAIQTQLDGKLSDTGDTGTGAYDFGGATSFEIPNGAGGTTVDAAGEITIDTTSDTLNFYDGTEEKVLTPIMSKAITITDPSASEDISLFYTDEAITITKMVFAITGSTSATATIRHGTDRSAAGAEVVTGGTVANSTTTGNVVTSFNDATVVADSFVWLETTALSGTPTSLHVTIFYKQDA